MPPWTALKRKGHIVTIWYDNNDKFRVFTFKNNAFKARSHSISATTISCYPQNESFTNLFPFVFQLEDRIKGNNMWI